MKTETSRTVQLTRRFNASAERVFDAWITPATASQWLFTTPTSKIVRAEVDARVGGSFVFADRRENEDVEHVGNYLEIDRPRRLVFTFGVPKYSPVMTTVTLDIRPLADGCELTLTHVDVLPEWADRTAEGWGKLLTALGATLDEAALTD